MADRAAVRSGLSNSLVAFVDESPFERESLLAAVRRFADGLQPKARVLDIGAGDAPYRELFGGCDYVTVDWAHSRHEDASETAIAASIDDLPLEDGAPDRLDQRREDVATLLDGLADRLTDLAPLDTELVFPLGWEATAWRR
jgi:hypothetical protein